MWKFFLSTVWICAICSAPVFAARIIVKDNLGFEQIPSSGPRHVVGTWFLKETGCTRSIEEVEERFYMVSRCKHKQPDSGLPLQKINEQLYTGKTTNWWYEITDEGVLKMRNARGTEYYANPYSKLWP